MPETPTRAELEAQLAERAWQDDAFRAELLANPTAVIRRELQALGITLSEGVMVHLHEETSAVVHLVLPPDPAMDKEAELDDEALDLVAGGVTGEGMHFGGFGGCV
jgi:hypothetical protein